MKFDKEVNRILKENLVHEGFFGNAIRGLWSNFKKELKDIAKPFTAPFEGGEKDDKKVKTEKEQSLKNTNKIIQEFKNTFLRSPEGVNKKINFVEGNVNYGQELNEPAGFTLQYILHPPDNITYNPTGLRNNPNRDLYLKMVEFISKNDLNQYKLISGKENEIVYFIKQKIKELEKQDKKDSNKLKAEDILKQIKDIIQKTFRPLGGSKMGEKEYGYNDKLIWLYILSPNNFVLK